ncbi:MAG: peptidylprolyl isomerase [Marinicella pacifica]
MKILLLILLLGQGDVLIEQHGAEVPVGDVDSYIHDLPGHVRKSISYDKYQLEKDILGMLNMNIINQYLKDSKLIDDPYFQAVIEDIKQSDNELDDEFINRMGLSVEVFKKSYQDYLTKKALYAALKDYILQDIDRKQAEKLAYDRYRTAKSDYIKPEQRDLAMIQLSQDKYSQQEALTLVKQLMADDTVSAFSAKAQELSEDSTADMNSGQLGLFKQSGFRFPFAETVFDADIGVVPAVFEKDSNWYIVRVNKIVPPETIPFDQVKDKMVTDIMNHSMRRRFQSIITQYAQYEVQVNKDLVDDIFTRYEVFQ